MEGAPPIPAVSRTRALAVASALNGNPGYGASDTAGMPAAVGEARQRWAGWRALLEVGGEPADWVAWLRDLREVDRDLHAGTAGFAAEEFFRSALEFIDRHDGPEVVRDVVIFRHGLAGWNFEGAAAAAQRLLEAEAHRNGYIMADELQDGGTIALLRIGELEEAERFYAALLRNRNRSVGDLRSRLLTAYVSALTETDAGAGSE
jgi:hypothetical protein